eukprot:3130482-Lingulodinium_polyedra.AAC.1
MWQIRGLDIQDLAWASFSLGWFGFSAPCQPDQHASNWDRALARSEAAGDRSPANKPGPLA